MKKIILLLTAVLCSAYVNAQWKLDSEKSDDIGKEYTYQVGSIEISKRTSEMSPNIDFNTKGGIIEFFNRNIDREGSGNGLFINTQGFLDGFVGNTSVRYTVKIIFTDGTFLIKDNRAHIVTKAEPKYGIKASNFVDVDLSSSDLIILRNKLIRKVIVGNKQISINNSIDIKKVVNILWFDAKS